ncbi:hypothetical protein ACKWTF_002257 [Chironomus riparius]
MNYKLGKRNAEKAELNDRAEQSQRTQENFFTVVQIAPVPETYTISQVLLEITPYVKDAIGIMRVADYKAKRLGETVFIYFPFKQSAQYLESIKLNINNNTIIPIEVSMKVGRATFIDKDFSTSFQGVPITVILKSLERKQEAPIYYLLELVRYFERKGVVTGMRLNYDAKRDWTLPQGFITFLRQADARQVGGEGGFIEHIIQQKPIRATLSENIPMLVAMEDAHFLESGIVQWNQEAEALNQLITTYEWPGFLNSDKRVDNKKLIENLYEKYHKVYPGKNTAESSKAFLNNHKILVNPREDANGTEVNETPAIENEKSIDATIAEQGESSKATTEIDTDSDDNVLHIDLEADIAE